MPRQQGADAGAHFDWARQWYPLAPLAYLDKHKPQPFSLLGQQLVVWWHAPSATWQVLQDRCPHRLAPLSEVRLEPGSGELQCSYHGWRFGATGHCTAVPQADSPQAEGAICASPCSKVASFPAREEQGLLWVWMQSGPSAATESGERGPALPEELMPGCGGVLLGGWYMRELPVSVEHLLENLLDPVHVHFAHHGVIGSRDRGGPISVRQVGQLSPRGGFTLEMTREQAWGRQPSAGSAASAAGLQLVPETDLTAAAAGVRGARLPTTAAPSDRGVSSKGSGIGDKAAGGAPSVTHFVPPGLVWLEIPTSTMLPTPAGAPLRHFSMLFYAVPVGPGFSRILAGYSTDALPGGMGRLLSARESQVPHMTRAQVLDRYEQHTRHCPSCRRALGTVRALRALLQAGASSGYAAAFTLAVLRATLPGIPAPLPPLSVAVTLSGAALTAGALAELLRCLEARFVFVDYVHASK